MKTYLITGASGGIGSAIAKTLAKENNKLILVYNKNADEITNLNKELSSFLTSEYKRLCEGLDSSLDMIDTNVVNPNEMGAATNAPGEFSQAEITDKANLENTAKMSNDNQQEDDAETASITVAMTTDEEGCGCDEQKLVDISTSEEDGEEEDNSVQGVFSKLFGENTSETAKALKEAIDEVVGTDYAGPLDFNPDVRISTADVLNTLKKEIGDGSEGIHVDRQNASSGKYVYKVSQIDEKLLPKKIKVGRQELTLEDGSYISSEVIEEQPK
jgi:NAD(P)-dependent dehydrogenase (short-subunit alcohol dehydrogenase family)